MWSREKELRNCEKIAKTISWKKSLVDIEKDKTKNKVNNFTKKK